MFVNEVDLDAVADIPFSAFFTRVTLIVEELSEVNVFGGVLHFEVVLVEPEFACANIEIVDGGAGDVGLVWVLHLWVSFCLNADRIWACTPQITDERR